MIDRRSLALTETNDQMIFGIARASGFRKEGKKTSEPFHLSDSNSYTESSP